MKRIVIIIWVVYVNNNRKKMIIWVKKSLWKQFGSNADKYVNSKIHAKGLDLQYVVQQVESRHNNRLLDVATGGGHVANMLAPMFEEVVALDLTEQMLEKAKVFIKQNGHENVSFVAGNAEDLPFAGHFWYNHMPDCSPSFYESGSIYLWSKSYIEG